MRVPIILPNLGSGDEPVRLCGWLVEKGDLVITGDPIAEVLIPGITYDVIADATGRLMEIAMPLDSIAHAGDVLGWLEDGTTERSPR